MRKQFTISATLIAVFIFPAMMVSSFAQESTEIEITAVQVDDGVGGVHAPMIIRTVEESGDGFKNSGVSVFSAQPNAAMTFVGDEGSMFFGGGGNDHFSMLSNPSVRKELELVDDQMESIKQVNADFSKKIRSALGDLSKDGFNPEKASLLKETVASIQKEKKEAINQLLLPHQQERLEQVALQMKMKNRGTANTLGSKDVQEALGLSDDQIKDLKKRSGELSKEIQEKTAQLKADAKEELLGMLSKDQRKKLESMTGDTFETRTDDWKSDIESHLKRRTKSGQDEGQ